MERKTQVLADEGKQELTVVRDFDLPVDQLFRAHTDPDILAQWMGTRVLQLDNHAQGAWAFQTCDASGQVLFAAKGCIHDFVQNQRIVRTFEMDKAGFEPQLEFLDFEAPSASTSRLRMQIIYRSVVLRDQQLRLPFAQGIDMAHNRLQELFSANKTK